MLMYFALIIGVVTTLLGPVRTTTPSNVPILLYHHIDGQRGSWHVSPQKFEEQLAYLSNNGYHTISMTAYVNALQSGSQLPDKSIILTFDDGYRDAYEIAFPLLKKYGMSGTFFIITGVVGFPAYMTWDQIAEMQKAGMEFEAHTVHHPFLTRLPVGRTFLEMYQSRIDLESHLQVPVEVLAYPYNDHNRLVVALAQLAGFKAALVVSPHTGDVPGDLYEIPRITIASGEGMKTFAFVISAIPKRRIDPRPMTPITDQPDRIGPNLLKD